MEGLHRMFSDRQTFLVAALAQLEVGCAMCRSAFTSAMAYNWFAACGRGGMVRTASDDGWHCCISLWHRSQRATGSEQVLLAFPQLVRCALVQNLGRAVTVLLLKRAALQTGKPHKRKC
eukprot:4953232-Amphidinium_carterae.1